ncbi:glycosyl hydrolase family 28-related protein (plasmid) [Priestia filamentosa]|nr:glycosyl hydrolase family 28-related protein [Priestia filamentosa]
MSKPIKVSIISMLAIVISVLSWLLHSEKESISVSVISFKANGNDKDDDTKYIQEAIDFVAREGGGTVTFPKGIYFINTIQSIKLRKNITLKFNNGVTLKAIPNASPNYEILHIHDVRNVRLKGKVEIIGERDQHEGNSGEWGFGISIRGSNDIYIESPIISNCWGDGIYIGSTNKQNYSKDITILNPKMNNNRRQGISIISAINLKIVNPTVNNTNGTAPESGIDLEPNNNHEYLQNIRILNPVLNNNKGYELLIYLKNLDNSKNDVGITVENSDRIIGDIRVEKPEGVKGYINLKYGK